MSFVRVSPPERPLPSQREMTLKQVELQGPKSPRRMTPAQLEAAANAPPAEKGAGRVPKPAPILPPPQPEQTETPAVNTPAPLPQAEAAPPAASVTAPDTNVMNEKPARAPRPRSPTLPSSSQPSEFTSFVRPNPAAAEVAPPLPSERAATMARVQREGPKRPHRVTPAELGEAATKTADVENQVFTQPRAPRASSDGFYHPSPEALANAAARTAPPEQAEPSSAAAALENHEANRLQPEDTPAELATKVDVEHGVLNNGQAPSPDSGNEAALPAVQESAAPPVVEAGGDVASAEVSRQSGLRPQTKPPAYVRAPAEPAPRPERLSQPLPPRVEPEAPASQPGQPPTMREMTLRNTERFGPKAGGNRDALNDAADAGPPRQSGLRRQTKPPAYAKAPVEPAPHLERLSQPLPPRAEPEAPTQAPGKLPSQREMTLKNKERFGSNSTSNHVRPEDLPAELAVKMDVDSSTVETPSPTTTTVEAPAAEPAPVEPVQPMKPIEPVEAEATPHPALEQEVPAAPAAAPPVVEAGGDLAGAEVSRQNGLRPQTKPPAYVKAPAEPAPRPERLSQPLPPRVEPEAPASQPGQLPTMREMTLRNTERFGPKAGGNRDALNDAADAGPPRQSGLRRQTKPPAYVKAPVEPAPHLERLSQPLPPRAEPEAPTQAPGKLPSQREMTLKNKERFGSNSTSNHVRPEDLPADQVALPKVEEVSPAAVETATPAAEPPVPPTPTPPAPTATAETPLPPPRPEPKLPSERAMTVASTEKWGPKEPNHVAPAALAAAEEAAAAAEAATAEAPTTVTPAGSKLPSQREMTIANTEKWGPKTSNHVPADQLPISQRLTADVYHTEPFRQRSRPAATAAPAEKEGMVASAMEYLSSFSLPSLLGRQDAANTPTAAAESGAAVTSSALPAPKLPSQREMTLRNTERWGPKGPNHVPPDQLPLTERLTSDVRNDIWDIPHRVRTYMAGGLKHQQQEQQEAVAAAAAEAAAGASAPSVEASATDASSAAAGELMAPPPFGEKWPSQREMTLRNTERWGPKGPNHIPPGQLAVAGAGAVGAAAAEDGAEAVASAVGAPSTAAKAPQKAPEAVAPTAPASSSVHKRTAATPGKSSTASVTTNTAVATRAPSTATPAAVVTGPMASSAAVPSGPTTTVRATAAGATALLSKPVSEWTREDVKQTGRALLENRFMLSLAAVGAAALTVFSIYKGAELYNRYHLNRCLAEVEREEPATVHLYILKRSPLAPSVSVPCSWVETYLRVARIPYEAHVISDPAVSPNGQMPFIIHRTTKLAGATGIIEYLKDTFGASMDAGLSAEQTATGVAMLSALEYSLTRGYTRSVFLDKPDVIKPYYSEMNATPDWITRFALQRMASRIEKRNRTTGYAFYSAEQSDEALLKDTRAVEALLSARTFLFSDTQPSSFDCALYAWLLPVIAMESSSSVSAAFRHMVRSRVLVRFVKEMTVSAFPDFEEIVRNELYLPDATHVRGAIKDRSGSEDSTPTKKLTFEAAAA